MSDSDNVWIMNVNRLLNNDVTDNANEHPIVLINEPDQFFKEQSTERKSCDRQISDKPIDKFFSCTDLVQLLHTFLDIATLYSFSQVSMKYYAHPGYTRNVEKQQLAIIISPELMAVNKNKGLKFLKNICNNKYIYEQNADNCINGMEHPYHIPREFRKKCTKFTDVYPQASDILIDRLTPVKVDYALHYKLVSEDMELYHKVFRNYPISNALQCLVSFSNTKVNNCFLGNCDVGWFIKHYTKIQLKTSKKLQSIIKQLWQTVEMTNNLGTISLKTTSETFKIKIRSICYFVRYFEKNFYFKKIFKFINWETNLIAGGAVFQALIATRTDTIKTRSDLDIFAYNVSYSQWLAQLVEFENKLLDDATERIRAMKSICNKKVTTYYIIREYQQPIKIQFIFSCESTTPAQILTNFDISAVQVAFNPVSCKLFYSYAFLDFLFTGQSTIFNLTQHAALHFINMRRIIKYHTYGIRLWKFPVGIDLKQFINRLNNTSESIQTHSRAIPISIGLEQFDLMPETHYSRRYFSNKRCLRSDNHDETHILRTFLNLLFDNNKIKESIIGEPPKKRRKLNE